MAAACRPTAAIRTARSAPVCTAAQTSLLKRRGMRRLRPRALRVLGCCGGVQWLIEPSPALAGIITLHLLNVSTESEHDLIQVRSGSSRQRGPPAVADWTGLAALAHPSAGAHRCTAAALSMRPCWRASPAATAGAHRRSGSTHQHGLRQRGALGLPGPSTRQSPAVPWPCWSYGAQMARCWASDPSPTTVASCSCTA